MLCTRCKKEIVQDAIYCPYCAKKQPKQGRDLPKVRRAQGSGCIVQRKRKKNPYQATLGKRQLGVFPTYADAERAIALAVSRQHTVIDYTLQDLYDRFLKSERYNKMSDSGKDGMATAWMRLSVLKNYKARDITTDDFQRVVNAAMQVPRYKKRTSTELAAMSPAKRAKYQALIQQPPKPLEYDGKNRIKQLAVHLCDEMIKIKLATVNYGSKIELPRYKKTVEKRNFTEEEKALLQARDADPTARIVLIYLACGFRLNELLELTLDDIDLTEGIITGGSKSAAGRNRRVPIPTSVYDYIAEFYAAAIAKQQEGGTCPYLLQRNNKLINDDYFRRYMFYPLLQQCGIAYEQDGQNVITPHRTRHTFIADSVKAGMTPEALTKIAGHSKYETSIDFYANDLDTEYLQREMEKAHGKHE